MVKTLHESIFEYDICLTIPPPRHTIKRLAEKPSVAVIFLNVVVRNT